MSNTVKFIILFMLMAGATPSSAQSGRPASADTAAYFEKAKKLTSGNYILLADLSIPSNNYRFFLLDVKNRKIVKRGLCCNGATKNGRVIFSNVPGSNCSSNGLYRIGEKYTGQFGEAYKLYGLETTNSNALKRYVVLHSHPYVPNAPCADDIVESWGCPTLNPDFFKEISQFICKEKVSYLYIQ